MTKPIGADSLVTLNLRIRDAQTGAVMFSSFETTPITQQMGAGELMPALERRLLGLYAGAHDTLNFGPGEAFGHYDDTLIERVARHDIPAELVLEPDTVYAFSAPDGSKYPGLVRELTEDFALIDFNHPLAGKAVTVDLDIIGVI